MREKVKIVVNIRIAMLVMAAIEHLARVASWGRISFAVRDQPVATPYRHAIRCKRFIAFAATTRVMLTITLGQSLSLTMVRS